MGQTAPPQIGGIASKLSADMLGALVGDYVDSAHHSGNHLCGLVIDLQTSFNLIPRLPLHALLTKLGVPSQCVVAHLAIFVTSTGTLTSRIKLEMRSPAAGEFLKDVLVVSLAWLL